MRYTMQHTFVQLLSLHFIWITWNKHFFMIPMLHNISISMLVCQSCNIPWNRICKNQKSWLKNMFFLITVIFWICLMLHCNPFIFDFVNLIFWYTLLYIISCFSWFCNWWTLLWHIFCFYILSILKFHQFLQFLLLYIISLPFCYIL